MPVMASNQKSDGVQKDLACFAFSFHIIYNSKYVYPEKLNVVLIQFYCWGKDIYVRYCSSQALQYVTAFLEMCVQMVLSRHSERIPYDFAVGYSPEAQYNTLLLPLMSIVSHLQFW